MKYIRIVEILKIILGLLSSEEILSSYCMKKV